MGEEMRAADRLLLRVSEAAEVLGISRSHMYELIQAGEIPVIRLGSSVRVPRAWLIKLIDDAVARWQKARSEIDNPDKW